MRWGWWAEFTAGLVACVGVVHAGPPSAMANVLEDASNHVDGLPRLSVLGYDSLLLGKHSLGTAIIPEFEKSCHCRVNTISSGDGGQILTRLQIDAERGAHSADVVIGLDRATYERAKPYLEDWGAWRPKDFKKLAKVTEPQPGFLPFDYGYFALMADRKELKESGLQAPTSLQALLKPEWNRKVALEDPRTSTPGLAFLLYIGKVEKDPWAYWKAFRSQVLTFAPGWDAAYGIFLKGEAPLAWSYVTSQAYHEEHGDPAGAARRYEAVLFDEGQPVQVEGAALVKGTSKDPAREKLARSFLEFLISRGAQEKIPQANWMTPAREGVKLPPSFEHLPKVRKAVQLPSSAAEIDASVKKWTEEASGGGR